MTTSNALFLGTSDDAEFVPHLKHMFNGWNTFVVCQPVELLTQLEMYCAKRGITVIVSTNTAILKRLVNLQGTFGGNPKLSDYQGSLFTHKNLELVFVSPLRQLFTVPYGKFIAERFISKVVAKETWAEPTDFHWTLLTPTNIQEKYDRFSYAYAIATDIETYKDPVSIRCISWTAVFIDDKGNVTSDTIVLAIDSLFSLAWLRKFNALAAQKIFQNGKYDNSYLLRYDAFPDNWLWDTQTLFHCIYSELPKDLAFLNAFYLRAVVYWKDLAETNDLFEYYRYNGLDSWATANVWIQQLRTMPDYAKRNYALEFPLVYPCLLAEMTGLKRDMERLYAQRATVDKEIEEEVTSLRKILAVPAFNTNSPTQVKTLLAALGCVDIPSTEEKDLAKAAYRHPINGYVIEKILKVRGLRKLASTYLRLDSDAEDGKKKGGAEFYGRYLSAFNPHGTDSGRLASKSHHFWCGGNMQNIPVGEPGEPSHTKATLRAEDGFNLGEGDLEQAETRDTAYISGDEKLISNVTGSRDFHSINASEFFGIPYVELYDDSIKKTKNKKIRDLSKRTNHGANYNMGPDVLVDTMGLKNIWGAKILLKLAYVEPRRIAMYLLDRFHATYPTIRGHKAPYTEGTYYAHVAQEIVTTRKLVSRAFHHTEYNLRHYAPAEYIADGDWTRYCFGDPTKSKPALNSYVSHPPQSLNARTLNEGFMRVFYEIALPNPDDFRLHAQIHDSILFSYRTGRDDLASRVKECMEIPVSLRDIKGRTITFLVPASLKLGKRGSLAVYWNETE